MLRALVSATFLLLLGWVDFNEAFAEDDTPSKTAPSKTAPSGTSAPRPDLGKALQPFLTQYCTACHGSKSHKGDRRFDQLPVLIDDDNTLVDYQDILDQLNLGEMPPLDAKQPSDQQRREAIAVLTKSIAAYHRDRDSTDQRSVLRRLNAREYRNTIRDLLHIDTTIFDPTIGFPLDETDEHLDNIGDSLVTSAYLLAKYLDAAESVIEKAVLPLEQPPVQTWTFRDGFRQQPEIDQVHRKTNQFAHMTLYDVIGADKPEGAYGPIHAFAEGVPYDGVYEIRLKAEAVNRLHPYDDAFLGRDRTEPLRLGIVPGNHQVGELHLTQPIEPLLTVVDLADQQQWYSVRVHLDAGYTPRFTFINGLMDARNLWSRLIRKYPGDFPKGLRGIVDLRYNAIKLGKLPHIRIHEIEIKGPIYDQWPRVSQQEIFGDTWESVLNGEPLSDADLRRRLTLFASRAYRRTATDEEIDRLMAMVAVRKAAGSSSLDAFFDGLKAVLCSPNFLYLEKTVDGNLSSHELATRLAYFLWSSMPDDALLQLAESDKIQDREVLVQQVRRMLADPRSDAMVDGFLDSWLTLRDLGSAPPDRSKFKAYYQYDLGNAMRRETHEFTRYVIDENMSIVHFIDSDFSFVNKPLARFYALDDVPTDSGFHKVALTDRRRGGLLGQASILTVTANGIETSPVVRGVWILENLLGTPPTPPPADVEPLDPDVRGATTIREQLQKHRSIATCNECHRKIDPLGFALESFDPIGGWRNSYEKRLAIDTSGALPSGETFDDVRELKTILIERKEQFARSMAEKMLAYAIGRRVHPLDRPIVDALLEQLRERDYGMRDLIEQVVLSEIFRSR